jgi:hypothetical protein
MREELIKTYQDYYVEGFRTNDVSLIDKIVRYPIASIKDGKVEMLDSYPVDPAQLKAELEWDHSIDWSYEVSAVNETTAHMAASATRCRKDGSVIEHVHAFYAFTKTDDGWKMYAMADIIF